MPWISKARLKNLEDSLFDLRNDSKKKDQTISLLQYQKLEDQDTVFQQQVEIDNLKSRRPPSTRVAGIYQLVGFTAVEATDGSLWRRNYGTSGWENISLPDTSVPTKCGCLKCIQTRGDKSPSGLPLEATMMIVCPKCGDKRCPHAEDHSKECTKP